MKMNREPGNLKMRRQKAIPPFQRKINGITDEMTTCIEEI